MLLLFNLDNGTMVDGFILVDNSAHYFPSCLSGSYCILSLQSNEKTTIKLSVRATISSQCQSSPTWVSFFHGWKTSNWKKLSERGEALFVHNSNIYHNCGPGFTSATNCPSAAFLVLLGYKWPFVLQVKCLDRSYKTVSAGFPHWVVSVGVCFLHTHELRVPTVSHLPDAWPQTSMEEQIEWAKRDCEHASRTKTRLCHSTDWLGRH